MISEALIIALSASIIAPAIMAFIQGWLQRAKSKADWARQDDVAMRVAWAAKLLEVNTSNVNGKLDKIESGQKQIHTLVNSNLTAEMQARKDSIQRELLSLHEIVTLKQSLKVQPNAATIMAIKTAEDSIAELNAQLIDRLAATKIGESEAKEDQIARYNKQSNTHEEERK